MIKKLLTILALGVCMSANAQSDSKTPKDNDKDIKNFIGKIIGTKTEVPKASFIFDISKSPELKLNVPVPLKNTIYNQLYFDGKVASSNDFTPLFKSGTWLPDLGVNLNYTKFLSTTTKYYTSEIEEQYNGDISKVPIDSASQLFWLWSNIKAGYNYATLETYNNNISLLNKEKFSSKSLNSLIVKADMNFFFYPSKRKLKFLSFNGKVGYEYKTNDNNYSSLRSVNIKEYKTVSDGSGNTMEVSSDAKKVKEGTLIIRNTSSINYNIMALISTSKSFYIGFSTYGKQTLRKDLKSLDAGFGITVPITKNDNTLASFTLKYEIPDINDDISDIAIKEKGILGFSIGLPLNVFGRN